MTTEGFLEIDGRQTWYRSVGEPTAAPPLLMLHGGPGAASPNDMLAVARESRRRQVICYDQIDTGRSPRAGDVSKYTLDAHLRELDAVRNALHLETVHLWGQSWGGMLALAYVLTKPTGVRSLTLASAPYSTAQWLDAATVFRAALPPANLRSLERCERTLEQQGARKPKTGGARSSAKLAKSAAQLAKFQRIARSAPVQLLGRCREPPAAVAPPDLPTHRTRVHRASRVPRRYSCRVHGAAGRHEPSRVRNDVGTERTLRDWQPARLRSHRPARRHHVADPRDQRRARSA